MLPFRESAAGAPSQDPEAETAKKKGETGPIRLEKELSRVLLFVRKVHAIGQSECMVGEKRHTTVTVLHG